MPHSTTAVATLRPDLADSVREFDLAMDRQGFIGAQVMPVIEVASQSGNYGVVPLEQLLQERDTKRAPGSGYSRGNFTFDVATYACLEQGAEEPVDDREAKMYANYFDAEAIAAQRAIDAVLRNDEKRKAAAIFNATTFTSQTTSITEEWDDFTNATPIDDVHTAALAVWGRTGLWPNALVVNIKVFKNLRQCDQIKDAITSAGAGDSVLQGKISRQQIAQALDIEQVIVAGAAKNTAYEGQTRSLSPVWSDEYAMVCRVAETNDPKEPCLGRTFHWGEDGSTIGGTFETYRDENVRANIVRCRHDVDEIIIYSEAGQLLDNVTT